MPAPPLTFVVCDLGMFPHLTLGLTLLFFIQHLLCVQPRARLRNTDLVLSKLQFPPDVNYVSWSASNILRLTLEHIKSALRSFVL